MVQDYQYLNERTIKNNYLLPLILDIVENIGTKKIFTKLDLQWDYNNVQIKKGDKWKMVFTISEESFELTVMFFGLTNALATFQTMMNEILWDLINTGKVASFIDNVIVRIEKCYKTSVWTDFRQGQGQDRNRTVVLLLVYNGKRACDLEVM